MAQTHRRLQLEDLRKWRFVEGPLKPAPEGGVIVKTSFAGICHTDVHISYRLFDPNFKFPVVLGHEIDGIVDTISPTAAKKHPDLKIGDRVIVYPWGYCRNCDFCKAGSSTCPNVWLPTGSGPVGSQTYGVWKDGGYQNFVIVEAPELLVKVPEDVPMDQAALIPCSGITAYNASEALQESVTRAIKVKGKARIAVFGCGGLCLWAIQILRALYSNINITAVDVSEDKLVDAKQAGADITYCWPKDGKSEDIALELIKKVGATLDGAIDFTGMPSVLERAFHSMDVYGTVTMVGLGGEYTPKVPLGFAILRNIILRGNMVGTQKQCEALVELVRVGKVKGPPIEYVTLDDVERIIDLLHAGKQRGRAVVKF